MRRNCMRRSSTALAGLLAGLTILAACSSNQPVTNQPVTNQPVTNQPVAGGPAPNSPATQSDSPHQGDVVLTPADDGQLVTITIGQTVAVVVPHATSVFIAESMPEQPAAGSPVTAGATAVLTALGGFRFRAVGTGRAVLAAEYNCPPGASCALRWTSTVDVQAG